MSEARQREIAATQIPRWGGDLEALEVEDPAFGHAERDRPRQPAMEGVGRQALEAILLRALQELLEAAHLRQPLHAAPRLVRHDPTPADEDEPAHDRTDAEPRLVDLEPGRRKRWQHESGDRRDRARQHPARPDLG